MSPQAAGLFEILIREPVRPHDILTNNYNIRQTTVINKYNTDISKRTILCFFAPLSNTDRLRRTHRDCKQGLLAMDGVGTLRGESSRAAGIHGAV